MKMPLSALIDALAGAGEALCGVNLWAREDGRGDVVVVAFNVSREDRRVDLPVGGVGPLLLDAVTGEELPVTDGELRGLLLPPRAGRAVVAPPAAG